MTLEETTTGNSLALCIIHDISVPSKDAQENLPSGAQSPEPLVCMLQNIVKFMTGLVPLLLRAKSVVPL